MWRPSGALVVTGLALSIASGPSLADPPTDLFVCGLSPCIDWMPRRVLSLECDGYPWVILYPTGGFRQMWGPLLCVGPIEVSLHLMVPGGEELPLFVEARWDPGAAACQDGAGSVLWQTYGRRHCHIDSLWITSPRIDLPRIVGMGNRYWLQLEGMARWDADWNILAESGYSYCIQVRSFPTMITATATTAFSFPVW